MNTQGPKQQRSNANFALFPLPHSEFRLATSGGLAPHAMAGFVLA
jgi:hypothetical protein